MKEIKAFLQPHVLPRVIHALHELPHFPGLTVIDVVGQGRGRGLGGTFVLTDETLFFHKRKLITIVANASIASQIIEVIRKSAHTGRPGDGLILVTKIESAIRIRSGEVSGLAL